MPVTSADIDCLWNKSLYPYTIQLHERNHTSVPVCACSPSVDRLLKCFRCILLRQGYLETSPFFFSGYTNGTIGEKYRMPEAFFYTAVAVMLLSFTIVSAR